jgi:carbonic anhydrase/acetyltransferase-like protein (isoleucine patch superfamily)
MLIANKKPICLIGFDNSTITQEAWYFISKEFSGEMIILSPDEFLDFGDKDQYQYIVAFTLDTEKRKYIINVLTELNLDSPIYVHDSVVCYTDDISTIIGKGTFIAPNSTVLLGSKIGKYCVIETYCLVSHYVTLSDNVILHSGTMIAGKTAIGPNCIFNFKSAALNGLSICGDIELGACSVITKDTDIPGYYLGSVARRLSDNKTYQ